MSRKLAFKRASSSRCRCTDAPDAPRSLTASAMYRNVSYQQAVELSWQPPLHDHGGVTRYVVQRRENSSADWLHCCHTRYCSFTLLYDPPVLRNASYMSVCPVRAAKCTKALLLSGTRLNDMTLVHRANRIPAVLSLDIAPTRYAGNLVVKVVIGRSEGSYLGN